MCRGLGADCSAFLSASWTSARTFRFCLRLKLQAFRQYKRLSLLGKMCHRLANSLVTVVEGMPGYDLIYNFLLIRQNMRKPFTHFFLGFGCVETCPLLEVCRCGQTFLAFFRGMSCFGISSLIFGLFFMNANLSVSTFMTDS